MSSRKLLYYEFSEKKRKSDSVGVKISVKENDFFNYRHNFLQGHSNATVILVSLWPILVNVLILMSVQLGLTTATWWRSAQTPTALSSAPALTDSQAMESRVLKISVIYATTAPLVLTTSVSVPWDWAGPGSNVEIILSRYRLTGNPILTETQPRVMIKLFKKFKSMETLEFSSKIQLNHGNPVSKWSQLHLKLKFLQSLTFSKRLSLI